ncbi:MAG: hypothetical protein GQ583_06580 [Methyloprofundus sp.]|nr:hypothetical protein [Methyloprofundus sp.]
MQEYDLVFEGGGAKGSVFVGALEVFFKNERRKSRRLLGTSAGAITATLLAAKFTPNEMLEAVNEQLDRKPRFATFMDIPDEFTDATIKNSFLYAMFQKIHFIWPLSVLKNNIDAQVFNQLNRLKAFRGIFSFIERGGVYSGETFVQWMEEKLEQKGDGYGNMSLSEFYNETDNDLSLVITDTKDQLMRVLNHRTAPDCPVKYAVRMSMSIPFVWQEVLWKQEWGLYLGTDITGNTIVDGGVLSNFPIDLMNSNHPDIMGEDVDANDAGTLGFLIDESQEVGNTQERNDDEDNGDDLERKGHRVINRIKRLIDTMTGAHDQASMITYKEQICKLPAKGYGTTEFDMSEERLDALIEAGRKAMQKYFLEHPAN